MNDPDTQILRALWKNQQCYTSGVQLAEQLGFSRSAVWKRMEGLQAVGYPIQSQPHLGYRLGPNLPDILYPDEITARLDDTLINWKPIVFKETQSTNDLVWREAKGNFPEGLVILADRQTHGRGRQGRVWQSVGGLGLYASILLRPSWSLLQAARLTILASISIAEALEEITGIEVQIKWPNDIYVNGRKLGGILTEVQGDVESIRFAVIGFGVNVGQQKKDFSPELQSTATSLAWVAGKAFRRVDVLIAILKRIAQRYEDDFSDVRALWSERCLSLGKLVQVRTPCGIREGQAVGLDEDGALILRVNSGQLERVTSGDVV